MKRCTKCKAEKELKEFSKDKNRKDGLSYRCKGCRSEYKKIYYLSLKSASIVQNSIDQCKMLFSIII